MTGLKIFRRYQIGPWDLTNQEIRSWREKSNMTFQVEFSYSALPFVSDTDTENMLNTSMDQLGLSQECRIVLKELQVVNGAYLHRLVVEVVPQAIWEKVRTPIVKALANRGGTRYQRAMTLEGVTHALNDHHNPFADEDDCATTWTTMFEGRFSIEETRIRVNRYLSVLRPSKYEAFVLGKNDNGIEVEFVLIGYRGPYRKSVPR